MENANKGRQNFLSLSAGTWLWFLEIQLQESSPTFEKVSDWGKSKMKIERTPILFLSDVFAAAAVPRSWLSATDTTTSSIVGLMMLGCDACAFAVVRKRMQQLPTTRNRVYKRTQHLTSNNVASVYTGLYHPSKRYAQSFYKKR